MIIIDYLQRPDGDTKGDLESKRFADCKGMRYMNLKRMNLRRMGKVLTNVILHVK